MALSIGTPAPHFHLYNSDRQPVSLAEYSGKWLVIHFFPAAFTSVCTAQLCSSSDDFSFYTNLGIDVVGVSVDMPFTLKVFKEQHQISFPLLSDFNKNTIRDYDMYLPNFICDLQGVAKRGVALIDPNTTIAYAEETPNPGQQVNFDALKQAIRQAKGS